MSRADKNLDVVAREPYQRVAANPRAPLKDADQASHRAIRQLGRGVYQVFTLSWDVSLHRLNARSRKPLTIAVARANQDFSRTSPT
jgi:hypothetical protein